MAKNSQKQNRHSCRRWLLVLVLTLSLSVIGSLTFYKSAYASCGGGSAVSGGGGGFLGQWCAAGASANNGIDKAFLTPLNGPTFTGGQPASFDVGYDSAGATPPGVHVVSWVNIIANQNDGMLSGIGVTNNAGSQNQVFQNTCINMVASSDNNGPYSTIDGPKSGYYTQSPYHYDGWRTSGSPGGVVFCDPAPPHSDTSYWFGKYNPPGGTGDNVSHYGSSAVWYQNQSSSGTHFTVNIATSSLITTPQTVCLRFHVSVTKDNLPVSGHWGNSDTDLQQMTQYDVPDLLAMKGTGTGAYCFTVNPPPPPNNATSGCNTTDVTDSGTMSPAVMNSFGPVVTAPDGSTHAPDGSTWSSAQNHVDTGSNNKVLTHSVVTVTDDGGAGHTWVYQQNVGHGYSHVGHWTYNPLGPNVTVTILHKEHLLSHNGNGYWITYSTAGSGTYNCYSATCTITNVWGDGPNNVVMSGGAAHITVTVTNGSGPYNQVLYPTLRGGSAPLSATVNEVPHGIPTVGLPPGGTSAPIQIDFYDSGSGPHTFTFSDPYPDYWGAFALGPNCSGSAPVLGPSCTVVSGGISCPTYTPFSLAGIPSVTLNSPENPTQITYNTAVCNYNGSVCNPGTAPVNAPITLDSFSGPNCATAQNAPPAYTGTWSPGLSPPQLSGTCNPPPGSNQGGDKYCAEIDLGYTQGVVNTQNPGDVQGANTPLPFSSCQIVTNRPFFKVYNGGAAAGGAFSPGGASSCSSGSGTLAGWNNNSTGLDFGAGAQFSALSLTNIVGFASGQGTAAGAPEGLTFSNTTASSTDSYSPTLGGQFGGSQCLTALSPGSSGTIPGPLTINGYSVPKGINKSIFVDGDVYINGDIIYQETGGTWSTKNVPSFVLHATGNIYIDKNVHELDGLYEAVPRPDGTKGEIYTCASGFASEVATDPTNYFNNCHNQLAVYGSFIANKVNMLRTFGSLRDETPTPASGGTPAVSGATAPLIWSYGGPDPPPASGYTCIPVREMSPPQPWATAWADNQLCAKNDPTFQVHLGWTTNAYAPEDPGAPPPQDPSRTGLPTCTASWGSVVAPTGYPHDQTTGFWWDDNYLCSDAARISFQIKHTNPDPSSSNDFCTEVLEPSDSNGGGLFQGVGDRGKAWVCISKYVAGAPATPATPHTSSPCSNNGTQMVSGTCAAEVFYQSPELYLSTQDTGSSSGGALQYNAVTSLPPVL